MQPLIDSHVHFWDPQRLPYTWLDDAGALNRPFTPADLPASGEGWRMEQLVFIQSGVQGEQTLAEVDWVAGLAESDSRIGGVVAFAPLANADGALATLEQLTSRPLVRGVRRSIASEPDGFAEQVSFVVGVGLLAQYGYSFDIAARLDQLPEVVGLVGQCPDVWFALDHAGSPNLLNEDHSAWREQIRALAALENVYCKVSGLMGGSDADRWQPEALRPYLDHLLATFGADRLMLGSDWPVLLPPDAYAHWVGALLRALDSLSESERSRIFHDNARRFYRLGE